MTNTYSDSYIINYPEGDQSLERVRILHREDIEDRVHTIIDEDTLTSISTRFYGSPNHWYIIADVNNIENPLELIVGQTLIIPNIERYNV